MALVVGFTFINFIFIYQLVFNQLVDNNLKNKLIYLEEGLEVSLIFYYYGYYLFKNNKLCFILVNK